MPLLTALLLVLGAGTAHADDCVQMVPLATLTGSLDAADAAWRAADESTFLLKMEEAHLQLPCLNEPVTPTLAARYHRNAGLWLYVSGDKEATARAFSSAKRVEADHALPADMLPAKHPIRALFDDAPPSTAAAPVDRPATGQLTFDGTPGDRPTDAPTVAQLDNPEGGMVFSTYLQPGDTLPAYPVWVKPKGPLAQHKLGFGLAAGSGALLVGGGVFALVARSTQKEFTSAPPQSSSELDAMYNRNRTASTTSAVLLGAAGAMGVGAVFAW